MAEQKAKLKFEQALSKLEEITGKLEEGNLSLEDSLKLFSEGIKLSEFCSSKLDEAKKKIEVLVKSSDGIFKTKKFDTGEE